MSGSPGDRPEQRPGYQAALDEIVAGLRGTQERLRRLIDALEEVRITAQGHRRRESPRDADIAAGGFAAPGFEDVWDEPLQAVHHMVLSASYAIGQHLEGMARLLDAVPLAFTDVVLMRAVVETSARAWWLLEPGIATSVRGGRFVTERLYALHQEIILLQKLPDEPTPDGPSPPPWRELQQRESHIRAAAEVAGFTIKNGGQQRGHFVDGSKRLGSTELINQLFGHDGLGRTVYHTSSTTAHATSMGLMSQIVGDVIEYQGESFAPMGPNPRNMQRTALFAMLATREMVERLIVYDGLEETQSGLVWTGLAALVTEEQASELGY